MLISKNKQHSFYAEKLLVLYHANCADGMGAAYAFQANLIADESAPDYPVSLVSRPMSYGDAPPTAEEVKGAIVVILDFSFKLGNMIWLASHAKKVILIDHHDSAARDLADWDAPSNVEMRIDQSRSGAVLAWKYMSDEAVPELLLRVEDRDLWRWHYADTKEIMAYVFSQPMDFDRWQDLIRVSTSELRRLGEPLVQLRDKEVSELSTTAHWADIAGTEACLVNAPWMFSSELGHYLLQHFEAEAAGTYMFGDDGSIKFSLRTDTAEGFAPVNKIAEKFGGGGHPNAAGFAVRPHQIIWSVQDRIWVVTPDNE